MATALQSYNRFNLIYTGFEFVNKTEFNLCEVNINIFLICEYICDRRYC